MSFIAQEAKKLAAHRLLPTHQVAIENSISEIMAVNSVIIDELSEEKDIELYMATIKSLRAIGDMPELSAKINSTLTQIEEKFEFINKRIRTSLYEKVKTARLINDYTIKKASTAFDIEITSQSFTENATAQIGNGQILGVSAKENGNVKSIPTDSVKYIKVEANDGNASKAGFIVKKIANGWTPANAADVIEQEGLYVAQIRTLESGKNDITIDIDLGAVLYIESICPVFTKPEIIKIYTSKDGVVFNTVSGKIATKDTTFLLQDKGARYIKIIIHKDKPAHKKDAQYVYETSMQQIKISAEFEKKEVEFETKEIGINKNLSKFSITTIDNYDMEGVDISYYIKINDSEYTKIRPTGKLKNKQISSIVRSQNITENKIIEIKDSIPSDNGYLYDLEIPQAFTMTNEITVLGGINEWMYLENRYRTYAFSYEDININTGSKVLYVDGEEKSGIFTIAKGLRKIEIKSEDFVELFNPNLIKEYKVNGSSIVITMRDGSEETIVDPHYPYNLKLIIDTKFFLIGKEILKENIDYKYRLIDTNLKIETTKKKGDIYCIYSNLYTMVSSIKIKGILKSTDNKTIPEITKITVRAE